MMISFNLKKNGQNYTLLRENSIFTRPIFQKNPTVHKMNPNVRRAYLELHFAVLLFGVTAILGVLIHLPALVLVWWRLTIALAAMLIYGNIPLKMKQLPMQDKLNLLGIGVVVGLHWVAFFGAGKLANASITLVAFATTSFMSSFLEPLLLRQKIKWYEVALGIVIIPAMVYVVGTLPSAMGLGVFVALVSAFLAVMFSILNKKMIAKTDPLSISFFNLSGAWLLLTLILPFYFQYEPNAQFLPSFNDWIFLLILSLLCTNLGYWLGIRSLRHISAFSVALTLNLEPVYGIILAWLILKEDKQLNSSFYVGASVIIVAVLGYPFLKNLFEKNKT
jgi:drug/metabolite transporter (DMT)-like permease